MPLGLGLLGASEAEVDLDIMFAEVDRDRKVLQKGPAKLLKHGLFLDIWQSDILIYLDTSGAVKQWADFENNL